ncbi:NMT1/THI5 like-domain-containing protein [Elsinoe ampelina]|uniref:4-amino-5-hydroxymethyl-2-methylpyrimidine phosphate synthase n=1 Tax=Elsinoe ampelina TaxID=302913 RepID=A0A6A6GI82_9PEZI|nr:NMT1/THI5 like-domain-containing protein [Elsinoe ampelina]
MPPKPPTTIRVALDWTPNTLHTGLFLAQSLNFYTSANLNVTLLPPSSDYSTTPARLVAAGEADLAICPSESCLAYAESGKLLLQAIYAICQRDASAIVTTKPEFKDLKALGGATYGSYNARYEDEIVRSMVAQAGGDGNALKIEGQKGKLSLFEATKKGEVDATWVFLPWEGVEAELDATELGVFRPGDYGVPYGYSPVICRNKGGTVSEEALKSFVRETARGYQLAMNDVGKAVEVMKAHVEGRSEEFLRKSQEAINGYYGDTVSTTAFALGQMDVGKWKEWVDWLRGKQLLTADNINLEDLFTNQFFNQCMLLETDE